MITIHGGNPSAQTLRNAVGNINTTFNIHAGWGARYIPLKDGLVILNGVARRDAREQLEMLAAANLNTPQWTADINVAKEWVLSGSRVWGRNWIHTRGTDIIGSGYVKVVKINRTKSESRYVFNPRWLQREWWVKVIDNDLIRNEWRIHIFQGRSIGRGLKVQTGDTQRIQPVRNRDNGWTMVHNVEPSATVKNAAAQAVKAVGYNFGAVDLFEMQDDSIVVLEVNSAPALRSDYTIAAYTTAFSRISEGKWLTWRDKDFTKDV